MTIENMQAAQAALQPYVPLVMKLTGKDTTLERIVPLMKLLGDPQRRLRVVHVAGTSGKTSTAYYLAALLHAAGQTVGLTVSPHIDTVTERVQINGRPLDEKTFCRELGILLDIIKTAQQPPSYFELLCAFALWEFARQGVDYAVAETGLGGLYDATNVITNADKVCVITDIGFDHMSILGNTLGEIAAQKIGIAHPHNQVFMYQQAPEIMAVVRQHIQQQAAQLHIVRASALASSDVTLADFQQRNWRLAYEVYEALRLRYGLPQLSRQTIQTTQQLGIPARMDRRVWGSKTLIMDGAHNLQKMQAFVSSFQRLYPNAEPAVLLAFKQGKDYQAAVPEVVKLARRIILTDFSVTQDIPVRSMDLAILADALRAAGANNVTIISDQAAAVAALRAAPEPLAVIVGSFYLLSQLRNNKLLDDTPDSRH